MDTKPKPKLSLKWIIISIIAVILISAITFGVIFITNYNRHINHTETDAETQTFVINSGDTISVVAKNLYTQKLIISENSFKTYANLNKKTNILAGTYQLSSAMTIPEIADILVKGQESTTFNITFLPGGTVMMAEQVLIQAGFSEEEAQTALTADYTADFPDLFIDKPADTDLEGYLFGETYQFDKGTDAQTIIRRFLSRMQTEVKQLNLVERYQAHNLNLYEGLTLASIIQKEESAAEAQKQVAGVFFNRIALGMSLGSDPTYQYASEKFDLPRHYNLDSPYNTRIYTGLTPTPISTPGISALEAVADPEDNNYLYFLSGDDNKLYFGRTDQEHQQNIINYCQTKCQIL